MKEKIFRHALELFYRQGIKFTMNELAKSAGISKRTLYEVVSSKEQLALFVIQYYFDLLKVKQDAIRDNPELTPVMKLKELLTAMPDMMIDRFRIDELKNSLPAAYEMLSEKIFTGWDKTFEVLDQAKALGLIKDIDNHLFSVIYSSALEGLMLNSSISRAYSFKNMQEQMVDILIAGIKSA